MKRYLLICVALLRVVTQNSIADPQTERIRKGAEENSAALTAGDFSRVVDFTYPKAVEMLGGREKMVELLRHGTEEMQSQGAAILGAQVTEPKEVVTFGTKRFAIVPMVVKSRIPEGTITAKSFLLAISTDEGMTWTFLDGAGITKEILAQVIPDFPPQLSLPTKEPPTLERN